MRKSNLLIPEDYVGLLAEVKERIRSAQYNALRAVNKELVALYWDLGRVICKRQTDETSWGKAIVERLAADLRTEFPGIQGFSTQNLWYMRQFYLAYHGHEKLQPLVGDKLPHRQAPAQRTQGAITRAGRDRQAAGRWGMSEAMELMLYGSK